MNADAEPVRTQLDLTVRRIRPAYEQVADQLRELVLSGKLGPGDRLPVEGSLSAEFGVSRSTVREAIRLLSSQSLVHTTRGPTGGTFVSEADPESIRQYLYTSIGSGIAAISLADGGVFTDAISFPSTPAGSLQLYAVQAIAVDGQHLYASKLL